MLFEVFNAPVNFRTADGMSFLLVVFALTLAAGWLLQSTLRLIVRGILRMLN